VVIILGLGFTGQRLAKRLRARGEEVFAPLRGEWKSLPLPARARVAVTIPPVAEPDKISIRQTILDLKPARLVYISSTGVYGEQVEINESSEASASDERGRVRLEDETWYAAGPWSSLILRSSAIYGPNRGVHAALREGRLPRGSASGVVSRIHVEDLAALAEAGLYSDLTGAWPVADEAPCSSGEIANWYAALSGHSTLGHSAELQTGPQVSGRRVDGREICKLLGVKLQYPSWQAGILASLDEEETMQA
jgi:nucleoside-diphosphate-sugar epimerase